MLIVDRSEPEAGDPSPSAVPVGAQLTLPEAVATDVPADPTRPRRRWRWRKQSSDEHLPDLVIGDVEWLADWAARPVLRGWLHTAAVPVVAGLAGFAVTRAQTRPVRIAAAVYAGSVTTMLSASAAYHRLTRSRGQERVLRRADHAAIFACVAGTFTPLAVATLPTAATAVVLTGVWSAAAAGIVTKMVYIDKSPSTGSWLYATMGWVGAGLVIPVARRAGLVAAAEVAAGGIVYTVGAALFRARRPNPLPEVFGYHEVWHTFVLAGVALHLDAVRRAVGVTPPHLRESLEHLSHLGDRLAHSRRPAATS